MPNPNNFITDSDYKLDMVAKVISGSFTFKLEYGTNNGFYKVAHGLGFTPLVSGFWSLDPNFAPAYAFGYDYYDMNDETGANTFGIWSVGADDQYIWFQPINDVAYKTYYFKVYCLIPSYLTNKIANPSLGGFKNYIFNSDLAYLKLAFDGQVYIPSAAGQQTGNTVTVSHNLGYLPFVRSWWNNPTHAYAPGVYWLNNSRASIANVVDSNTVKFSNFGYGSAINVIYRIYADEA